MFDCHWLVKCEAWRMEQWRTQAESIDVRGNWGKFISHHLTIFSAAQLPFTSTTKKPVLWLLHGPSIPRRKRNNSNLNLMNHTGSLPLFFVKHQSAHDGLELSLSFNSSQGFASQEHPRANTGNHLVYLHLWPLEAENCTVLPRRADSGLSSILAEPGKHMKTLAK